jgi:ribonuclease Z
LRLCEAGIAAGRLSALFVTHHHSDHLTGLTDVLFTRWLENHRGFSPLPVVAPRGPAVSVLERMMDPWSDDIEIRRAHVERGDHPAPRIVAFDPGPAGDPAVEVWRDDAVGVRVLARSVHHEPVLPAVAYRVETPDGAVVISGDTSVCDEVGEFARGANVLVHEALRRDLIEPLVDAVPHLVHLMEYHSDVVALGSLAEAHAIPHLLLTHLIPAPRPGTDDEAGWIREVRRGGYTGKVTVARDLVSASF